MCVCDSLQRVVFRIDCVRCLVLVLRHFVAINHVGFINAFNSSGEIGNDSSFGIPLKDALEDDLAGYFHPNPYIHHGGTIVPPGFRVERVQTLNDDYPVLREYLNRRRSGILHLVIKAGECDWWWRCRKERYAQRVDKFRVRLEIECKCRTLKSVHAIRRTGPSR